MAAATSTGPISIEQINTTFYVWGGGGVGFPTIQAAVDYVRVYNGDLGLVYIVHGHDYSENIATITGGGSAIVILDDRQGANQYWYWNGTQYTPAADVQLAGFVAEGMPLPTTASIAMGFSPTGDFGNGSGNLIVTADPTKGMPSFNLTLDPQDGTGLLTFLRAALNPAGSPRIQMPEALEIYKNTTYPDTYSLWMGQGTDFAGSKGMYVWAKPTENAIDFQGQTIGGAYEQTIRLNYLGGDIFLGANASVGEDGTLTAADVTADSITAGAAVFDTCLVDESPVRTFANTADGPSQGMIWPTIGIPVSAGDHWQDPSIDPTTLATWPTIGIPVSAGDHWQDPSIDPTTLATWPAAGIAVSTGTAWSTPIVPADVPRLSAALNTFTGNVAAQSLHASGTSSAPAAPNSIWMDWAPNGFARIVTVGPSAGVLGAFQMVGIDGAGGTFNTFCTIGGAGISTPGSVTAATQLNVNATTTHLILDSTITSHPNSRFGSLNTASTTLRGGFQFDGYSSDFSQSGTYLLMFQDATGIHSQFPLGDVTVTGLFTTANGNLRLVQRVSDAVPAGSASISADADNLVLNAAATGSVSINYKQGNGTTHFWNGNPTSPVEVANIDASGNAHFNGSITAGSKAFRIPHPLDETKDLMHGCLEGPEFGVYYRGEAVTKDGAVAITLPDYFEALTRKEGRTIQLTELYDDEREPMFGNFIAAGRINNGKFNVRTTSKVAVKFYWEVKAVRRDIAPLEVKTKKREIPRGLETTDDARADRDGEVEVGEPKSKKVRA